MASQVATRPGNCSTLSSKMLAPPAIQPFTLNGANGAKSTTRRLATPSMLPTVCILQRAVTAHLAIHLLGESVPLPAGVSA